MDEPVEKSALIIPVPEAESLVRAWRERLDPACSRGIPAHITVLFPFAHPTHLDDEVFQSLGAHFSKVKSFDFGLTSLAWFDDRVVYLEPNPDTVFRNMTRELLTKFPQYLPYGGKYNEPTPHLTVGDGAPIELLEEAADDISLRLPITVNAKFAWLMTGGMGPNSWKLRHEFSLGHSNG
jgi:2'-5' RNA ligase